MCGGSEGEETTVKNQKYYQSEDKWEETELTIDHSNQAWYSEEKRGEQALCQILEDGLGTLIKLSTTKMSGGYKNHGQPHTVGEGNSLLWYGRARHHNCNCHNHNQNTVVLPTPVIYPKHMTWNVYMRGKYAVVGISYK